VATFPSVFPTAQKETAFSESANILTFTSWWSRIIWFDFIGFCVYTGPVF